MAFSVAGDLLSRPVPDRHRHGPAEGQRQRHRRAALLEGRHPARRRVLDLLHGDQPRRVHRAAGLRLARTERQLAHRVRRGRRRHDARRHPVRARRARISATPACIRRRPNRPQAAARLRRNAGIIGRRCCSPRSSASASAPTRARSRSRAKQVADGAGVLLLAIVVAVLRLAVHEQQLDARASARSSTSSACCSWPRRCSGRCSSRRDRR